MVLGSCQFPTLGFVVDQYWKSQSFVPERFWHIQVTIAKHNESAIFKWHRRQLLDQKLCFILYEKCMENCTATVSRVTSKYTEKW